MSFFTTAVTGLKTVVTAIGAGVGVWGVINLLEGYGNDNPVQSHRVSSSLWLSRCNQEKKGKAQSRRNRRLCQEIFVE